MDKDTKDCHILVVLGELKVLIYKLLKACVCLQAHIWFYQHHMFYQWLRCSLSCMVLSSPCFCKKGKSEAFGLCSTSDQTNSMLFKLWIKGSLAFLNFWEDDDDPSRHVYNPFKGTIKVMGSDFLYF